MSSDLQFQGTFSLELIHFLNLDFGLGGANSPFTSSNSNSNYDQRETEKDSAHVGSDF